MCGQSRNSRLRYEWVEEFARVLDWANAFHVHKVDKSQDVLFAEQREVKCSCEDQTFVTTLQWTINSIFPHFAMLCYQMKVYL